MAASLPTDPDRRQARPSPGRLPAFVLGLGLGGFIDGIVLHQILQWHHLLTGPGGEGAPTARRFERTVPEIRGWNRLAFYHNTDTPTF
jgi:Predicted membrane protein (DUF2243)